MMGIDESLEEYEQKLRNSSKLTKREQWYFVGCRDALRKLKKENEREPVKEMADSEKEHLRDMLINLVVYWGNRDQCMKLIEELTEERVNELLSTLNDAQLPTGEELNVIERIYKDDIPLHVYLEKMEEYKEKENAVKKMVM